MPQSYKVFFNDRTLFLTESITDANLSICALKCINPTKKEFQEFVSNFNNDPSIKEATISLEDRVGDLLEWFKQYYKYIQAAGGVVENQESQLLFIHRLGCWDLPKGKVETDEFIAAAAIREVEEECGISNPSIQFPICSTFHTYPLKDKMVLKETFWYKMSYEGDEDLIPQTDENIAVALWRDRDNLEDILANTYPSIREVLAKCKITA